MRTRRSPRNQEHLWRALGADVAPQPTPLPPRNQCWNCRQYPRHGRERGTCALRHEMVYGRTEGLPCFELRAERRTC